MPQKPRHTIKTQDDAISIRAELAAYVRKEEPGIYLSHCPALDLYSQGSTQKEAREAIIEATQLLLEGGIEDGTLEEILQECGFSLASNKPFKKALKNFSGRKIKISTVIPLVAA